MIVEAETTTTLEELRDKAIKKIREKYHKDVPKDVPLDLEFELVK